MHTGPLGSTIHVLQADAGTITELAAIDWNRWFPRVCLDPVLGLVTLITPSRLHEDLTGILDHVVDAAASLLTGAAKGLRHTRLRGHGDPPGTGMEPDCGFYLGERAQAYRDALVDGAAAADAFLDRTPLDLVVETEITNFDEGKIGRYAEMGVRELWRLHGGKDARELRVEFLALQPGATPPASQCARPRGRGALRRPVRLRIRAPPCRTSPEPSLVDAVNNRPPPRRHTRMPSRASRRSARLQRDAKRVPTYWATSAPASRTVPGPLRT